ncbi:Gfo/Idh/MocA family oxidoreductase [Halosimplex marinum]|uniref:Gfo/Idh/MocA family oxidoreductase n=1 Tax=Halosimplex marinum TaxID=3396620 RepID=UPI003F55E93D
MTQKPIPVAVVGAGNMGSNHVRVYDELPGARLTEVVEPDPERAREIREEYDVEILDDPEAIERAEAATVSVPNDHHCAVAETCLRNGLDVLVEKPLATTVADAEAIVSVAEEEDAVLQVGHIERFNPAVETLAELLDQQRVIAFEAHRLGPFNEHLSKESVIFDLMIHDLDVIESLVDAPVEHIDALGSTARSEKVDHAVAQFEFENGVVGTTTASHVTNGKVRSLDVTTEEAYIKLNYQEQDIVVQRRGTEQTTTLLDQSGYRTERITENPYIRNREPLKNELEHFLDAVRERRTPAVSGEDGVRAVKLATEVVNRIKSTR